VRKKAASSRRSPVGSKSARNRSRGSRKSLSPHERRVRALFVVCSLFAVLVLVTSFPISTLLNQHAQLSSTAKQLALMESENEVLKQEAKQLASPVTINDIARRDYGLVAPGSQAFEILPAPGSSSVSATSSGHVPLDGPPVVPGSIQSQQLLAAGALQISGGDALDGTGAVLESATHDGSDPTGTGSAAEGDSSDGGFWSRVEHTLEFWR